MPSTSIRRPVGANPGGSIGPSCVPSMRQAQVIESLCGSSHSGPAVKRRSGKATHERLMKSLTSSTPRAGSGSAGSSQTMSGVTRSSIMSAS
jgi:hypothetical protein